MSWDKADQVRVNCTETKTMRMQIALRSIQVSLALYRQSGYTATGFLTNAENAARAAIVRDKGQA